MSGRDWVIWSIGRIEADFNRSADAFPNSHLKSHVMQRATLSDVVRRYQHLTKTIMPELARSKQTEWPVRNDHCFQRIVLDTICNCVWYDHIARPAYKHLSVSQALRAVQLCEDIITGRADLTDMNRRSLAWRGKLKAGSIRKLYP